MKCHKEDAPLLGLMGQSMRLIGKRAQELYAEYDLNRAQSGILFALHQEDSMCSCPYDQNRYTVHD